MKLPKDHYSIAYSIAYVRVCEWANNELGAQRPKPEILEKALVHARKMEDLYLVRKIQEAYVIWDNVERTLTPQEFPPPAMSESQAIEKECTGRFKVFRRPSTEVKMFKTNTADDMSSCLLDKPEDAD